MARRPSGAEVVNEAKKCLKSAKIADELRQAQAVLFPIELGLSMEDTAKAIGVTRGWACQLRTRFIKQGGLPPKDAPKPGGRRRENMNTKEEIAFLKPFFDEAKTGGILVVSQIKKSLDKTLGREVPISSVYNLLHRHGWRKLAPDKHHPKVDKEAQETFKKNSQKH